jgi:hypothetical protein
MNEHQKLTIDRVGVDAYMRGDEIHYAYPVTVIVARKAG